MLEKSWTVDRASTNRAKNVKLINVDGNGFVARLDLSSDVLSLFS